MPIAGTNLGTVYDNDQGKGLAVTLDTADFYKNLALLGQGKAKAAEDKQAGAKALAEAAPEVKWTPYINRVQEQYENLLDEAGKVMAQRGINNLWTSTDPEARRLVKEFSKMKGVSTGINSLYSDYQKRMEDINNNPDKYTEESIAEVVNFPDQLEGVTYEDIQRGSKLTPDGEIKPVALPDLKFKHPSTLHDDFYIAGRNNLKSLAGDNGVVEPQKIIDYTATYFLADEKNANLKAQQQIYRSLDPESGLAKRARSEARMAGFNANPEVGLAIYNMKQMLSPDVPDIGKDIAEMAGEAPILDFSNIKEDAAGKVTGSGGKRLKSKSYPMERARQYVSANRWILERPEGLAQLGIDPATAGDSLELFEQAVKAVARDIEMGISTEQSSSLRFEGDSRFGQTEIDANADDWQKRIWYGNKQIASEAIGWLKGEKMPGSTGIISDAQVITPKEAMLPQGINGVVVLTFKDEKSADAARIAYYKSLKSVDRTGKTTKEIEAEKKAQEGLRNQLDRMFRGKEFAVELNDANWQLLKNLHRQRVKSTGALYGSKDGKPFTDRLNIQSRDRLNLDD